MDQVWIVFYKLTETAQNFFVSLTQKQLEVALFDFFFCESSLLKLQQFVPGDDQALKFTVFAYDFEQLVKA